MLTPEQTELLRQWENAKTQASYWKEQEMELRKQVAHAGITDDNEGTNRAEIGNGYQLKTVIKINYKIDSDRKAVDKVLARLPDDIADRLIKWTPTLSLTEYKALNERHKAIADTVITTSEGAPTVEIIEPKKKPV